MAMMSGNGGRGRRNRRGSYVPMSEINVTPMVDVMLVLLVVFMVSAPLMTVGVPVDLPKTDASQMVGQDEPLVVSVNEKGEVFLQETKITLEQLVPRLVAITQNKKDTRIFVRGDKAIAYGQVMEVMGTVNLAGFTRVALLTQLPTGTGAGGAK
ncbi:MAG: protein TolR [Rhodospirillaceae bacterium]|jgi:biopolymer transport protein TolR|nr:protein TolR [Rhodospirillaceae bacterium]